MKRLDHVTAAIAEAECLGAKASVADRKGRHLRILITIGNHTRAVFTARTPSDWRTAMNLRRDVRRTVNALQRI